MGPILGATVIPFLGRGWVRPILSTVVCLSVTLMYCGQTAAWIKMKLGMQVGLHSGHIVLDEEPAPPTERGTAARHF